jgi:hypothetical protein
VGRLRLDGPLSPVFGICALLERRDLEVKEKHMADKFRAKYGARDVAAYYPKQDAAVDVRLA